VGKLDKRVDEKILEFINTNVFYEDGVLEADSKTICFFEFKSYIIDEPICNLKLLLKFELNCYFKMNNNLF
jgi:hypothetical protein